MTDKDFDRKPKFGPIAKKGSPKPPPKNCNPAGWTALRALQPAVETSGLSNLPGLARFQGVHRRGGSRTAPTNPP
jgi:hypothetical protein